MYEFKKNMRLCSQKGIQELFETGKGFLVYPFSVRYTIKYFENGGVKVLIVVPKKYHHFAIARNRGKRLMREAFRLNGQEFMQSVIDNKTQLNLSISLVSKTLPDFDTTNKKMIHIFSLLSKEIFHIESPKH